ncbi:MULTISPECIES: hypothetical protein [unclassified Streptomyces]|uniref:hypothetical protein n=1 Tax=unclassified Streptomyces TaxID=2593676 RepID=UPI002E7871E8|nr:hypothetical protein [Streptomyces sp. JV184]MEE1745722.1 hypothetical protein [Streptomyces sp. JV184]
MSSVIGEGGDGPPGDHEAFEVGLGLPQPTPQFDDPRAEFVGQGPGGVFPEAERVERCRSAASAGPVGTRENASADCPARPRGPLAGRAPVPIRV